MFSCAASQAGRVNDSYPATHFRLTIVLNSHDPSGALMERKLRDPLFHLDGTGALTARHDHRHLWEPGFRYYRPCQRHHFEAERPCDVLRLRH